MTRAERIEKAARAATDRLGSQRVVHRGRGEEWICEVSRGVLLELLAALASPPEEPPECRACDGAGKCTCESAGCVASCSFCGGTGQRGGT